ncbi:MBL fold metallo-hydrolase [Mycolicibacterium palauense]|uniref:MBL fold metallo-hydrolase n=1 Tax=Mycolicibacterium palauense TaxID=2034511 RepID=UPI00159BA6E2|nr:MBL fold metallo-hydrolase [Mycolicibacterium palauense]
MNNAGFVGPAEDTVLIDTAATESRTRALIASMASALGAEPTVRSIVNTHHHGDHTFGNCMFAGATVVGHRHCRRDALDYGDPPVLTSWRQIDWGKVKCVAPHLVFDQSVELIAGDTTLQVMHVGRRAHTAGDVIVWIARHRVLFAGDLLFSGGTPFVLSGSVAGSIAVLETVLKPLGAQTIVAGHGPLATADLIDDTAEYLKFIQRVSVQGVRAGLPPLQAAERADLGRYGSWLDAERIVGNLHRGYHEASQGKFAFDEARALSDMVALNGGPLTTYA